MALIFKEPETFKTPDGSEYVVLPVQVDDMPIMFNITNKREKLRETAFKEAKKKDKKVKKEDVEIRGEDFIMECGADIQKLITQTIINVKTGKPLPLKYRQMDNVLDLMGRIMKITTIDPVEKKDDDTPLEQKLTSSAKSSQVKPT